MRIVALAILILSSASLFAQWQKISGDGLFYGEDIEYDSSSARLYVVGSSPIIGNDSVTVNGTTYWLNGNWHPMGSGVLNPFNGVHPPVHDVLVLDTAVVVCGEFSMIDSVPLTKEFAYWKDSSWHSMGHSHSAASAQRVVEHNNELHFLGPIDSVDNVAVRNWAVYNGINWFPGDSVEPFDFWTRDLITYKSELIVAGNFTTQSGVKDIALQGYNDWEQLGQGILGDPWVNDLEVYDNLLWVAGEFYEFSGNAATGLMVWDGSNWSDPFPQLERYAQGHFVKKMNGELWYAGLFYVNGFSDYFCIARYDGHQLCVIRNDNPFFAYRLAVSQDTLYAVRNPGPSIYTWPLDAMPDTCFQMTVGQEEVAKKQGFEIYPNPANETINIISDESMLANDLVIHDALGRVVLFEQIQWAGNSATFAVGHLPSGSYHVQLLAPNGEGLQNETVIIQ